MFENEKDGEWRNMYSGGELFVLLPILPKLATTLNPPPPPHSHSAFSISQHDNNPINYHINHLNLLTLRKSPRSSSQRLANKISTNYLILIVHSKTLVNVIAPVSLDRVISSPYPKHSPRRYKKHHYSLIASTQ